MMTQEVEEATIRMEKASKYKWGGHELQEEDKVEGKGKEEKARRTVLTDDEREEWKKKHPGECWNYFEKGTCHFGKHCRFKHPTPSRRGSEESKLAPSLTEVNPKEGHVRLATEEDGEVDSETEEVYVTEEDYRKLQKKEITFEQLQKKEIERLRKEKNEYETKIKEFYETHPNGVVSG